MSQSSNSFTAHDPATGEPVWTGAAATQRDVDTAVAAARQAFERWGDLPLAERVAYLEKFGKQIQSRHADLIEAICRSTGKPKWESATEVDAMFGKVALTI